MLGDTHARFSRRCFCEIQILLRAVRREDEFVLIHGAARDHHNGDPGN